MAGSPAVIQPTGQQHPSVTGAVVGMMEADRDRLTHLLRGLASRLDELDRQLADLAWRQQRPRTGASLGQTVCERTALETEYERLTDRLGVLALRLNTLDNTISGLTTELSSATLVGTCPYCGYPSLGSGLCTFCRSHLAQ